MQVGMDHHMIGGHMRGIGEVTWVIIWLSHVREKGGLGHMIGKRVLEHYR